MTKADAQYGGFDVKQFTQSHDRFIIIDPCPVYMFNLFIFVPKYVKINKRLKGNCRFKLNCVV